MAWTKEKILENIEFLMRSKFETPEEAFYYYDQDSDGFLTKDDFKLLLKEAGVHIIIRGLVAEFMIQSFDQNNNKTVSWEEFQKAIKESGIE
ncbi:EF-hand domain-containing protein [Polaribacter litorisediminis]|uniref:EF-hand domain-containing protein n=1 Tax=Polaribacter litorisediminis TaxID=1908341 RepID=UPI001CC00310|nr:EF-hand domain-containing protein [Polaribacter litorisediminis]UAM98296.1 EF-hand domain-containing protein [Polaribacter litorisediminis]